jgi:hypothetical protein
MSKSPGCFFASTAVALTTLAILSLVAVRSISADDQCVVTPETRYNDIQQKSGHDSYDRAQSLLDQLNRFNLRSLEIDIHETKGATPALDDDWFVYHASLDALGDKVPPGRQCDRLSDCLAKLRKFHDASPSHEVVTVWLDVFMFPEPELLSRAIERQIPRSLIWSPKELLAGCPAAGNSLRKAVKTCGWPSISALQGKFIFVLTGSRDDVRDNYLNYYVTDGREPHKRLAFVAPEIRDSAEIEGYGFAYAIFYNIPRESVRVARMAHENGFVTRTIDVNDERAWSDATGSCVNHIATDRINDITFPFGKRKATGSKPFGCMPSNCKVAAGSAVSAPPPPSPVMKPAPGGATPVPISGEDD